ncbi:uncharacterized protein LOC128205563 [Mya arenaria]|uniref:uncharacterized protein LOC128205563 n=1 Tax=Mya arenaria TaxID=6604 RepID=UPI0022E8862F|nr:uncharacterized protein LOC128205563 [Mya arenaria]
MDAQRRIGQYREAPGSDIVKQGLLKKLKTMKKKYFILRSTSSSGPSRLDYYDSEKKFKTGHLPKRSIHLFKCFNINKKIDKHKSVISIFEGTECFSVIADSEEEQEDWLSKLLEYQNEYLPDGEGPKPHFEYVWQGSIKKKSKTSCTRIEGPYRLCLSNKEVSLVELDKFHPSYVFQFSSIRRCGHSDNFFFMEVGRTAVTGSGELWMLVEDTQTSLYMHNRILEEMATSRAQQQEGFRRRSNTGGPPHSSDHSYKIRGRTTSESHHNPGSPRRARAPINRPQSTVVYSRSSHPNLDHIPSGGSSPSPFDTSLLEEMRLRSDSTNSRTSHTSHTSRHSELAHGLSSYENIERAMPDGSFVLEDYDDPSSSNDDYLPMSPGQASPVQRSRSRSPTPPVKTLEMKQGQTAFYDDYLSMTPGQPASQGQAHGHGQGHKIRTLTPPPPTGNSDYLAMTPGSGQRSMTPSPTRHLERPASAGSEGQDSTGKGDGYMDMKPGSGVSSPGNDSYMSRTPPPSGHAPPDKSGYVSMAPPVTAAGSGYIDMTPGQRTPTDLGPGYMIMEGNKTPRMTAPIPIRPKEPGYMDMIPTGQPLATVKESGSGEAYLPMSPSGQSPMSMESLKPVKAYSYLSDSDSVSGDFPKRAYSVGSRPVTKPTYKYHQQPDFLRREQRDSSKSSSAPHLITNKRPPYIQGHQDGSYYASSPLSTSVKSEDSDSFMEMDFIRPRTSSDSYGCRPRASSFGKQVTQPHRPRSSSYGQGSKGNMRHLIANLRNDSFESIGNTSTDMSGRRRSQESIEKMSSSSRNSSNDSLKKLNEDSYAKKNFPASEYMDMGFDKRKTPSPNVQSAMSPQPNITGYVDMTIGTPKSTSRGVSPSSSTHSLGSSPASSVGHNLYDKSHSSTKIVKASGKPIQKSGYKTLSPNVPSENHLKVTTRLKMNDKRSPSSSGKESEDESYVQFKPSKAMPIGVTVFDDNSYKTQEYGLKSRPNIKVQHGYSKSYDSAIFSPEMAAGMSDSTNDYQGGGKYRHEEKHRSKTNEGLCVRKKINTDKEKALSRKYSSKSEKELVKSPGLESRLRKGNNHGGVTPPNKTSRSHSPTIEKKLDYTSMPDDDLFSNKMFTNKNTQPEVKKDDGVYLEYLPGDPATSTSVYNSKVSGTSKSGVKNSVANKGVDRIDKADKIGDRIGPKSPNLEARMEQPRRVFPDREYCEIDFPGQVEQDKLVNEQGNPDHVINKNESERLSNASRKGGENQTPKRTNSSRKSSEGFATRKHSESSVKTLDDSNGSKNGGVEKTPKKSSESQLTGKGESDMLKPSSDYMEADPAPLKASPLRIVKEKERSHESSPTKVKKKGTSDDFSYMDFDPASDKDTGAGKEEKSESITTPQRVKSYIAHSVVAEDIGKDDEIFVNTASNKVMIGGSNQGRSLSDNDRLTRKESDVDSGITFTCSARSNTSTEQKGGKTELYRSVSQQSGNNSESIDLGQRGESLSDVTTGIDRQTSQSSISSAHSTRKSSQDSMGFHRMSSQSSHESVSSVRKLSQDSSTGLVRKPSQSSQESIGSVKLYSLDKAHRQMVVKSTMPVAQEGQPIQDEGYCDIDYEKVLIEKDKAISNPCTTKMHHRSGSNSSSNSDRSRKVLDSMTSEDEIPMPDPARSFIGELPVPDNTVSFIADDTGEGASGLQCSVGSPMKPPLGGRRSSPGLVKDSDVLRGSMPGRNLGNGSQGNVHVAGVSRQTSVPTGPSKSPRTSGEIQISGRTRHPSGPAVMSTQYGKSGNGLRGPGQNTSSLEPLVSVLELHKQKSMPCMNIPVFEKVPNVSELLQDSGHPSRHSFSDLTQYEEMSFPADKLGQKSQTKCTSQQHLNEVASKTSNELHYADLELNNSKENVHDKSPRVKSRHTSSNDDITQGTVSYAEIDYQKTENLKMGSDVKFTL